MNIIYFLLLAGCCVSGSHVFGQETLPDFTVKNSRGKISISWQNKYPVTVKGITIQRSYDSSKGFSSITTMPGPNDMVSGFIDLATPYDKMYYRLFIVFDSGAYIFTAAMRPEVDPDFNFNNAIKKLREENNAKVGGKTNTEPKTTEEESEPAPKKDEIPYPSHRIYTGKDNNIVISLPNFSPGKYNIHFFDESNRLLFTLNKMTEGYFIIEKVNFLHAGWFFFEIYQDEVLVEKNKFYIPRD